MIIGCCPLGRMSNKASATPSEDVSRPDAASGEAEDTPSPHAMSAPRPAICLDQWITLDPVPAAMATILCENAVQLGWRAVLEMGERAGGGEWPRLKRFRGRGSRNRHVDYEGIVAPALKSASKYARAALNVMVKRFGMAQRSQQVELMMLFSYMCSCRAFATSDAISTAGVLWFLRVLSDLSKESQRSHTWLRDTVRKPSLCPVWTNRQRIKRETERKVLESTPMQWREWVRRDFERRNRDPWAINPWALGQRVLCMRESEWPGDWTRRDVRKQTGEGLALRCMVEEEPVREREDKEARIVRALDSVLLALFAFMSRRDLAVAIDAYNLVLTDGPFLCSGPDEGGLHCSVVDVFTTAQRLLDTLEAQRRPE